MIGVMSDSHDNREALKQAVSVFNRAACEQVIHAGDFVAPFAAMELANLTCPVKAVFGNCDGEKQGFQGNTLLINPGETGGWVTGKQTVVLFDPEKKTADIVPF